MLRGHPISIVTYGGQISILIHVRGTEVLQTEFLVDLGLHPVQIQLIVAAAETVVNVKCDDGRDFHPPPCSAEMEQRVIDIGLHELDGDTLAPVHLGDMLVGQGTPVEEIETLKSLTDGAHT